jgi:hypothetical protein
MAEQRPTDRSPADEQRPLSVQHQISDPITGTAPAGPLEPAGGAEHDETPDQAAANRSRWSMAARWFLLALLLIFLVLAYYWTR